MTVFRAVESWLVARREEMVKAGEEHIEVHMERLTTTALEHVRSGVNFTGDFSQL